MFAIVQNRVLNVTYQSVERAFDARSQIVQGQAMYRPIIGDMQRLIQVAFGNMIEMRDVGNGHPGANCPDIVCDHELVFLLESLESLHRLHCAKNGQGQGQAQ